MSIPLRISELEKKYVDEVLQNQFSNSRSGAWIRRLEETFANTFGVRYAIALCNGTATLHTALDAVGVQPKDEVIVPPLTMMSTTFCVLHAGAIPVYVDVHPKTFTLDPEKIEKSITSRTRAIITVSLYGCPPDMDPILAIAKKHHLAVIEDNAQCFLGYYRKKIIGSMSTMASYSFQNSKHLSCGEGGMLITDDESLALKARRFSCLGYVGLGAASGKSKITRKTIQDPTYERHASLGWNYRMAEPAAAIALAQTERIHELVERRQHIAALFAKAHQGCTWLTPQVLPVEGRHAYWTYALKLESRPGLTWHQFRDKYVELGGDGIYSAWMINYLEPVLRGKTLGEQPFANGLCPVAESLQPRLLQFKTNYMDLRLAEEKASVLTKTIQFFESK
jgi:perosamine synthetase